MTTQSFTQKKVYYSPGPGIIRDDGTISSTKNANSKVQIAYRKKQDKTPLKPREQPVKAAPVSPSTTKPLPVEQPNMKQVAPTEMKFSKLATTQVPSSNISNVNSQHVDLSKKRIKDAMKKN